MSQLEKPLLLTVREVASLLRIHRPKVYELIKTGTIQGFKLGADWRIKRDSVENLIGIIPDSFFSEDIIEPPLETQNNFGELGI
ncbi:MAG: helix-turn-helix domain-containing protein [Bdellovibrionales bacterium]|nr:helix-turn-helix domain-containing protein [Bdellovibrionales bacterium]